MTEPRSVLIEYFRDLQFDSETPYPEELGSMNQSGIDFEVTKLYEYIHKTTKCRNPFLMDSHEQEIIRLFESGDDDIRVSALLSIMNNRLPQLQIDARV